MANSYTAPCPFCQASAIREGELQAKLEAERDALGTALLSQADWQTRATAAEAALAKCFAETVERCAKVCEAEMKGCNDNVYLDACESCSLAIRALSANETAASPFDPRKDPIFSVAMSPESLAAVKTIRALAPETAAHIPTDAEAIEAEQLSEAAAGQKSVCTDCGHIPHLEGCSALYMNMDKSAAAPETAADTEYSAQSKNTPQLVGMGVSGVADNAAAKADTISRITAYLSGGGLFTPDLANHDAVRDLLIDCRDDLTRLRTDNEDLLHDIESHVGICAGLATDNERLRTACLALADEMERTGRQGDAKRLREIAK